MSFVLGGKTAKELGIQLLEDSQIPILPETRDRILTIPGKHGAYDFGADLGPRYFELECGFIYASTAAELQEAVRVLADHLTDNNGRPRDLELIFDREPDKKYTVRYAGSLPIRRIAYHSVGLFTLPLVAYDPHAYGIHDSQTELTWDTDLTWVDYLSWDFAPYVFDITGNTELTINNYGTIKVRPVIEISGSFTDISIAIGSNTFQYNEAISSETIVIDNKNFTVKKDGVNKIGVTNGVFLDLAVGENTVSILGTNLNCQIKIIFEPMFM